MSAKKFVQSALSLKSLGRQFHSLNVLLLVASSFFKCSCHINLNLYLLLFAPISMNFLGRLYCLFVVPLYLCVWVKDFASIKPSPTGYLSILIRYLFLFSISRLLLQE